MLESGENPTKSNIRIRQEFQQSDSDEILVGSYRILIVSCEIRSDSNPRDPLVGPQPGFRRNPMGSDRIWIGSDGIYCRIVRPGNLCHRCTQPNLQLAGGVGLDATRLFRDSMYQQHGMIQPIVRQKSSSEGRTSRDFLVAYVIDNKRFTENDRKEINEAINEINNYTNSYLNQTTKFEWPLINISYFYHHKIKAQNLNAIEINVTSIDSRLPTYELIDTNFIAQLKIVQQMDIHVCASGTGQMLQTFLLDGSVTINLGGEKPPGLENTEKAYASFEEEYFTSGIRIPYIKGLYYPINERPKGIKKDEMIKLIRQAAQLILQEFSLLVNPRENLAASGQLFVEMCEKDKAFCDLVTIRLPGKTFECMDIWVEDMVHESRQWKLGDYIDKGHNINCPFNHSLLHELRNKYGIKHNQDQ